MASARPSGKTFPTTGLTYHLFCSKSKRCSVAGGPADCWVGILRSAAAPSRPADQREAPPTRENPAGAVPVPSVPLALGPILRASPALARSGQ